MIIISLILAFMATAAIFGCVAAIDYLTGSRVKTVFGGLFSAIFLIWYVIYINGLLIQVVK